MLLQLLPNIVISVMMHMTVMQKHCRTTVNHKIKKCKLMPCLQIAASYVAYFSAESYNNVSIILWISVICNRL